MQNNPTSDPRVFEPVTDSRNRRIRGLWRRNGRYYLQLRLPNAMGIIRPRRIPLEATTLPECRIEIARKMIERASQSIAPAPPSRPTLRACCDSYLSFYDGLSDGGKRAATIQRERSNLAVVCRHLGEVRVDRLTKKMILGYIGTRLKSGVSSRTVNLDMSALRNALRRAQDDGEITTLPTDGIRPLRVNAPMRALLSPEQVENLFEKVAQGRRTGRLAADYLRFLAYSGAREKEALRVRWADVNFDQGYVLIGADGLAKNRTGRAVNLNAKLEAHLRDMHSRRALGTGYVFPSPRRKHTDADRPCKTLRNSLERARRAVGLPQLGFHDFRHYFASYCVMSGIDFKTIAEWLGHESGTMLIDRVYGHLSADHKRRMAGKVAFGEPRPTPRMAV